MSAPKNPSAYASENELMAKALVSQFGIRVQHKEDTSARRAHNIRQRLNLARAVDRKRNATIFAVGDPRRGMSDFDALQFLVREDERGFFVLISNSGHMLADLIVEELEEGPGGSTVATLDPQIRPPPENSRPETDEFD